MNVAIRVLVGTATVALVTGAALSLFANACAPFSGSDVTSTDEAGADAGPSSDVAHWCSQRPDAAFCADFDRPGAPVQDTFMSVESEAGSAIVLSARNPLSPPNAALTTSAMPLPSGASFTAALETTIPFPVVPTKLTLEFAMFLGACTTDMPGNVRVATFYVGADQWVAFAVGQNATPFWIGHPTGGPGIAHTDLMNAPALTGWLRVRMTITVGTTSASTLGIEMGPAVDGGALVPVLAADVLSDKVFPQSVTVHIGQEAVGPWGACQIAFDDVALTAE